ncbi:MAG TPA: peptidylprolyl isomerase, partial [Thermoanaerobaculia bacterium]|nr:peptidylprolyl isomerase [Thermoanaerobaculia bacterium]
MKKTQIVTLALALAATMAAAQESKKPTVAADADPVVITAGEVTVRQSEFENALKTLPAEYQSYAMGTGRRQFAEDYLRMKMLARRGMQEGLDKQPEVVAQINLLRENVVAQAALKRIESSITIPEDELKKIYESGKSDYEQVKARHILIAFKGSPAARPEKKELTKEEAKKKADEIRAKLAGGAKFEDLAKAESDDTSSGARGGDLGAFGRGQMVAEFEEAAFKAKPGEITVVETQFGYHVIKVDEHSFTPFAEVKDAIEKRERQKRVQAALEAMKTAAKPVYSEAYFP